MTERPKTIQIFLPDGNARSIRIAEITSRTVLATQVPRSQLKAAAERKELNTVGVYFLFGEADDRAKPLVYIGEAEDCYQRLKQHHLNRDFWNTAVTITSKTHSFTKAHVKFLEWYCLGQVKKTERYRLVNSTVPSEPYLTEPVIADLLDNFETIRVLMSTLGFPVFEQTTRTHEDRELFYCTARGANGIGEYVEDGFLVLRGSTAPIGTTRSAKGKYAERMRERLLKSGVMKEENDHYVFVEDYLFPTPSGASDVVLGRSSNGWTEWKDKDGKTLHELKRI